MRARLQGLFLGLVFSALAAILIAQQPINVLQLNGTTADTNSGNKSAGTARVVIATDQPALTNALKVDPSGVTSPVSGTVTANQGGAPWTVTGTGTAGTAASGVLTVQGIASMTKLLVTPDSIALPAHQSTNVDQWNGTTTDTNSGTKSAGTLRVVLATDQPQLTNKLLVTPDSVALPANQSVNVNQWNAQALASPDANSYPFLASASTATTTAGLSTCYTASAASTNSTNCKGSAGNIYAIHLTNTTTTTYYLRLYNSSSAPTCSSSTGFIETVPALGAPSASANGGINGREGWPQAFSTGISFCFTGGGSSTDNTNAATGTTITILYK